MHAHTKQSQQLRTRSLARTRALTWRRVVVRLVTRARARGGGGAQALVAGDVFGFAVGHPEEQEIPHTLQVLLTSCSDAVKEMAARLVNVIATDPHGRGYLLGAAEIVDWLLAVVTRERRDTVTRQNALGALQKLSIRRAAARAAMRRGAVEWLLKLLKEHVRGARLRARARAWVA